MGKHNRRFLKNNQKETKGFSRFGCAARLSQQQPLISFLCPWEKQSVLLATSENKTEISFTRRGFSDRLSRNR